MSQKRPSSSSNNDQATEDSDTFGQKEVQDFNREAKRPKLASPSYTTLKDLPVDVIENILCKVVVREVLETRLDKNLWIEKTDVIINRLLHVCSQWSSVITTNFFRNKVNGILFGKGNESIHFETVCQTTVPYYVYDAAVLNDEIYTICGPVYKKDDQAFFLNVYERDNLPKGVSKVIPLPDMIVPRGIESSVVSKAVYVLQKEQLCSSVVRIVKELNRPTFSIEKIINELEIPYPYMSLSPSGEIVILSRPRPATCTSISSFSPNGILLNETTMSCNIGWPESAMARSNGNIVLCFMASGGGTLIREIDGSGNTINKTRISITAAPRMSYMDDKGHFVFFDNCYDYCALDGDFCPVKVTGLQEEVDSETYFRGLTYNSQRQEILRLQNTTNYKVTGITILRVVQRLNPAMN